MDSLEIGRRIAQRRQALGLTLDDVADDIGVARSTIQRYEKGVIRKIKLPVIEAIARSLQVAPAWLCGMSDDMCASDEAPIYPNFTMEDFAITSDDFMHALYNESKSLSQEQKDMLLNLARLMRQEREKKEDK